MLVQNCRVSSLRFGDRSIDVIVLLLLLGQIGSMTSLASCPGPSKILAVWGGGFEDEITARKKGTLSVRSCGVKGSTNAG